MSGRRTADKGHGVDVATSYLTGSVDADLSELVPASTLLDSEQAVNTEANNLTTSLESELVANDEETTHDIVDDSIDASEMEKSTMVRPVSLSRLKFTLLCIWFSLGTLTFLI